LLKQLGFEKAQTVMSQSRDGNSADGQFIHRIFTQ
jgi:hypothetical protein